MNKKLFFLLFLFCSTFLQAQYIDYSLSAHSQGFISSEDENPFWMHSNQRGRVDETSDVSGWLAGKANYTINREETLELGLGGLYQNGFSNKVQLDEFYFAYQNNWLTAYAGRKQLKTAYKGLSATNQSVLRSLNARPLPGISFTIDRPIIFWKDAGLGFMASWEEFLTHDDRHIENVAVHHKSFHFTIDATRNFQIIAGVHHYAQWAGESSEYGKLPSGVEDYLQVITGGSILGGSGAVRDSEINALGNHLGGYEIKLNTSFADYKISLVYNTIFEDFSGIKLRNTPDGRYGIYIEDPEEYNWVNAFMYEYYFTRNQSKNYPTTDGKDNYFNNHLYMSGWTYESRIIGLPFIVLDEDRFRVAHNNIVAHHIGLSGTAFYSNPYKLLASYRANYGVKGGTARPVEEILSTYLDVNVWQGLFNLGLQVGIDLNSSKSSNVGFGVTINKVIL